jgi:lysozyme
MRLFTAAERVVIRQLAVWNRGKAGLMEEFLAKHVFTAESSQAVIIQPLRRYAVLYHAPVASQAKQDELERHFYELLALLSYLRGSGYITLTSGSRKADGKSLYYLHASFDSPRVENDTIVLNGAGDYTKHPDAILDKNGAVRFKGTLLEGDRYDLVSSNMTGTVCVSQALLGLIAPRVPEAKPGSGAFSTEQTQTQTQTQTPAPAPAPAPIPAPAPMSTCATVPPPAATEETTVRLKKARKKSEWYKAAAALVVVSTHAAVSYVGIRVHSIIADFTASVEGLRSQQEELTKKIAVPPQKQGAAEISTGESEYYGVDISRWNGEFSGEIDRIPKLSFAISKATEGVTLRDDQFQTNRRLLRARGIAQGGYHVFRQDDDPVAQAEFYLATVGSIAADDISPVVDVEDASLAPQSLTDPVPLQMNVLLMLKTLESRTGRSPILYTNFAFARQYLGNVAFSHYRLWLAEYTAEKPEVPDVWRSAGYFIWQKSASYKVGSSEFDLDVFRGSRTELLR